MGVLIEKHDTASWANIEEMNQFPMCKSQTILK
ncbi:DUF3787 domain-containing protein [Anaerobacillus sp. HL2]|nr:DUF3787 domain-containing protein [Anaerobacillus sp. HL2]